VLVVTESLSALPFDVPFDDQSSLILTSTSSNNNLHTKVFDALAENCTIMRTGGAVCRLLITYRVRGR
jgi:hypothetical protein